MELLFCDIYKAFIDACDELIKENDHLLEHFRFATYFGDIRDLKAKDSAFVSPANCYGSMNGGIDLIYNQDMFPNIQKVVMEKIGRSERRMVLKRSFDDLPKGALLPYLPIGEAIITPLTEYDMYETCYLISAPTMEVPMDIQGTDHPYKCFMAILNEVKQHNDKNEHQIKTIICPGLGTGIGGIPAKESAKQIFDALNNYVSKN